MGDLLRKLLITRPRKTQRLLEMLPGMTAWLVILFPLWGAILFPRVVAYFTVGFLVYWFFRSLQTAILGIIGYPKIKRSERTNWFEKYKQDKTRASLSWKKIQHIIIIPNYKESVEKITTTLEWLARQENINKNQINVVLAMEDRAAGAHQRAKELVKNFDGKFNQIFATFHPDNIPGEIRGKAANEAWAAKRAKKFIVDELGHNIKHVVVTSCDADACFHSKYFSALTYLFALEKKRYLRFWQSPIFWHNNFWRVPAFTRIIGTLGNAIHIANLQEPDNLLFNYSTYSLSLKMLDDVGYWDTDIIPEDWHIFLQSFFAKKGQIEVLPIFLPTSIDAPEGANYWRSLISRYEQCKRHAWGATDIPYAIKEAINHPEIPLWTRFFRIYKLIETHLIWSTNWFILTLGAWLPALINPVFKQTALGYNLPRISRVLLTTCLLFLLIMIVIDRLLRPKRPANVSRWYGVSELLQWILMPVASLFMSVLPGLDSQTRLMLGKRLEYRVTEKF